MTGPRNAPATTRVSHSKASRLLRGRKDGSSVRMLAGYSRPDPSLLSPRGLDFLLHRVCWGLSHGRWGDVAAHVRPAGVEGFFTCPDAMFPVRVPCLRGHKLGFMVALAERYESRYCAVCGGLLSAGAHGPLRVYCSKRCQRRAERARKAARAGLPDWHPSLRAVMPPARPPGPAVAVPQPRPVAAPARPQAGASLPRAPAAVPCQACGRGGTPYRLRGYTRAGQLVAATAALCGHCQGLAWAAWQSRFGMAAITPA